MRILIPASFYRADGYGARLHLAAAMHTRLDGPELRRVALAATFRHPLRGLPMGLLAQGHCKVASSFAVIDRAIGRSTSATPSATPPWQGLWAPAAVPAYVFMQTASLVGVMIKSLLLLGASMMALAGMAYGCCSQGASKTFIEARNQTMASMIEDCLAGTDLRSASNLFARFLEAMIDKDDGATARSADLMERMVRAVLPMLMASLDLPGEADKLARALDQLGEALKKAPAVLAALDQAFSIFGEDKSVSGALEALIKTGLSLSQAISSNEFTAATTKVLAAIKNHHAFEKLASALCQLGANGMQQLQEPLLEALRACLHATGERGLDGTAEALQNGMKKIIAAAAALPDGVGHALADFASRLQGALDRFEKELAMNLNKVPTPQFIGVQRALDLLTEFKVDNIISAWAKALERAIDSVAARTTAHKPGWSRTDTASSALWAPSRSVLKWAEQINVRASLTAPMPTAHYTTKDLHRADNLQLASYDPDGRRSIEKFSEDLASPSTATTQKSLRDEPETDYAELTNYLQIWEKLVTSRTNHNNFQMRSGETTDTKILAVFEQIEEDIKVIEVLKRDVQNALQPIAAKKWAPGARHGRLNNRRAVQASIRAQITGTYREDLFDLAEPSSSFEPAILALSFLLPKLHLRDYRSTWRAVEHFLLKVRGYRPEHVRMAAAALQLLSALRGNLRLGGWEAYKSGSLSNQFSDRMHDLVQGRLSEEDAQFATEQFVNEILEVIAFDRRFSKNLGKNTIVMHLMGPQTVELFLKQVDRIEAKAGNARLIGIVLGDPPSKSPQDSDRLIFATKPMDLIARLGEAVSRATESLPKRELL